MRTIDEILNEIPNFDETKQYQFYTSPMSTKEEIQMYLTSWIRKGHTSDIIHLKDGQIYELIGSFRRAGGSHGVFLNQSHDHFLFVIEENMTRIVLAEGKSYHELINNVADYYDKYWNRRTCNSA